MNQPNLTRVIRVLRKPPIVLFHRVLTEVHARTDRYQAPRRAKALSTGTLLTLTEASSLTELWNRLASRLYALPIPSMSVSDYERSCPDDAARIFAAADAAL